jgi:prophage antirepressor-like protein
MSSTFHDTVLRGEHDKTGTLWIPLEDINRLRGKKFTMRDLYRRGLLPGEDFQVVDPRDGDEFVTRLWPGPDQPLQIVVSKAGMRRLMMRLTGPADRHLRDWVTARSLPAIDATLPPAGIARTLLRNLSGWMRSKEHGHAW